MGGLEYHNGDSLAAGLGGALRRATLGGGESIFGSGLHRRTFGSDRCGANPDVDNSEVIGRAPLRDRRWRSTGTGQDSLPPAGCHIMRRSRSHPHHLITTASTAAGTKSRKLRGNPRSRDSRRDRVPLGGKRLLWNESVPQGGSRVN